MVLPERYLLPHTQRVAIGTLATTMGVAIDLITTHQYHCNRWTLYCHKKCLVAIGGTLYCHVKCSVAIDGSSIATLNVWLL
jgi:hypothetical protein